MALPALCSGCLLLGNPCGNKSDDEERLTDWEYIQANDVVIAQDDGSYVVPAMDCFEVCRRFAGRTSDNELRDLDSCELSLHPVLEDSSNIDDPGNGRDWKRVDAIESPVTLPTEWNASDTIIIAECSGTYRTECKN